MPFTDPLDYVSLRNANAANTSKTQTVHARVCKKALQLDRTRSKDLAKSGSQPSVADVDVACLFFFGGDWIAMIACLFVCSLSSIA